MPVALAAQITFLGIVVYPRWPEFRRSLRATSLEIVRRADPKVTGRRAASERGS
jgi:hypothetical protein